jgi:hypothetical protein
MSDKTIRLKIQSHDDREKIVTALANSGYSVYVEEEEKFIGSNFFVVFSKKPTNAKQ